MAASDAQMKVMNVCAALRLGMGDLEIGEVRSARAG